MLLRPVARLGLALCGLWSIGCHRRGAEPDKTREPIELTRGNNVVVEREAAVFFQGRVLSVAGSTLKVQTTEDGEPVQVSRGDAYRIPEGPESPVGEGPAICNDAPDEWHPCLVLEVSMGELVVRTPGAAEMKLPRARVVTPTAVTALDVRRWFERVDAERRFTASATSAGEPREPTDWTPTPHEPVLAKRAGSWFSAHVEGLTGDGGIRVRCDGDDRPITMTSRAVVPVPPFAQGFVAGQFVLIPPPSPALPWRRVRVEAASPDQAVVVDEAGQKSRVSVRELVPLGAAPGP